MIEPGDAMVSDSDQYLDAFFSRLQDEIPLTRHLGFQGFAYDRQSLVIDAALAPNHNDKGTAFAGSLSAAANLCGWALITLRLDEQGAMFKADGQPVLLAEQPDLSARSYDVVIRDSRVEYFLPVSENFSVRAEFTESMDMPALFDKLNRKGKARIDMMVSVVQGGELCFRLSGAYVALKRLDGSPER